jgi:hypothetical protein
MSRTIWTLGHSNHPIASFLALLEESSIRLVADVRRFPGSRRNPQFRREEFEHHLGGSGIAYHHFAGLGGRRSARAPDSPNTGWRVEAFNAYADYMGTEAFRTSLAELEQLAAESPTAILCAEALPWRCHRRLIADALIVRGWIVRDIMAAGKVQPHHLTDFARVVDGRLTYPEAPLFQRGERPEHDSGACTRRRRTDTRRLERHESRQADEARGDRPDDRPCRCGGPADRGAGGRESAPGRDLSGHGPGSPQGSRRERHAD